MTGKERVEKANLFWYLEVYFKSNEENSKSDLERDFFYAN